MGITWSKPPPPSADNNSLPPVDRRGHSPDEEQLSDRAIVEKIELIDSQIAKGIAARLPDKGLKLRARRMELCERLQRKHPPDHGEETHGKSDGLPGGAQSESSNHISRSSSTHPSFPSSKTSFCRMDEVEDAYGVYKESCITTSEGLSSPIKNIKGSKSNKDHLTEANVTRTPIESCSTPKIKCDYASTSNVSYCEDGRMLTRSLKRRKASENHLTKHDEWTEVHTVVLLDEGDEPSGLSHHEDKELDHWKDAKIHYPSRDHPECVEICYSDIKCLDPQSYLSSTIMNFYIQYLQMTISPSGRLSIECHFFSTYFYNKLEEAVCCKVNKAATFSKLRRWLKGVNIFQKAYIFLPIHGDLHWSLAIICFPAPEDESGPIILHMDSLGFHDGNRIFKSIESYLREEWEYICRNVSYPDVAISEKVWGELPRRIQRKKIMVPQQKNDYDCGLFVLYFIQRFVEEAPERLKKKDLAMFGNNWFQPEEASGLRRKIRKLLVEEFERSRNESDENQINAAFGPKRSGQQQ